MLGDIIMTVRGFSIAGDFCAKGDKLNILDFMKERINFHKQRQQKLDGSHSCWAFLYGASKFVWTAVLCIIIESMIEEDTLDKIILINTESVLCFIHWLKIIWNKSNNSCYHFTHEANTRENKQILKQVFSHESDYSRLIWKHLSKNLYNIHQWSCHYWIQ